MAKTKKKSKSKQPAAPLQGPPNLPPGMNEMTPPMMNQGAPDLSAFDPRNPMMRKMPPKMKPVPGTPGAAGAGPGSVTNQLQPDELAAMIQSRQKPMNKMAKKKMKRPGAY